MAPDLQKLIVALETQDVPAIEAVIEQAHAVIAKKRAEAKETLVQKFSMEAEAYGLTLQALLGTRKRGRPRGSHARNGGAP